MQLTKSMKSHRWPTPLELTRTLALSALLLAAGLAPSLIQGVYAFNTQFLDDAPISRFKQQDVDLMLEAIYDALDNAGNGEEVKWENPKSGIHGTVTPLNQITHEGMACREVDLRNFAGDFRGQAVHLMCKVGDDWRAITRP